MARPLMDGWHHLDAHWLLYLPVYGFFQLLHGVCIGLEIDILLSMNKEICRLLLGGAITEQTANSYK